MEVCIQPLGKVDKKLIPVVERGARFLYGVEVRVLEHRALPKMAYYKPRKRYRADKLLTYLDSEIVPSSECAVVIGFTDVDISTTKGRHKDWGIFGLAWVGGPSGVVSSHRLRRKANRKKLARRTVNVFNHELGHAMGSGHQLGKGCLMRDAGGSIKTVDTDTGLLCRAATRVIEARRNISLPAHKAFDWKTVLQETP
jgi:archaemetzincin